MRLRLPLHGRQHRARGADPIWPGDPWMFNYDNQGGYGYVQFNDTLDIDLFPDPLAVGGDWGGVIVDDSGDGLLLGSNGGVTFIKSRGSDLTLLADIGNLNVNVNAGTATVNLLTSGDTFVVNDHLGSPLVTYTG